MNPLNSVPQDQLPPQVSLEHQDPLITWAISNAKELNLSITQLHFTDSSDFDFHSFSCEITINQVVSKGFGKDQNQETAIKKSIIEAVERSLLNEFNISTSNGIAGHTEAKAAEDNAINELIERDLFLCHFLTKTPFKRMPDSLNFVKYQNLLLKITEKSKIRFSLYYLEETGCLGIIDGRSANSPFGFSISSSYSDSLENSIENTILNLSQRGHYYENHQGSIPNISLSDFLNIKSPNFEQHGQLALNLEYANLISFLFENKADIEINNYVTKSSLDTKSQLNKNLISTTRLESANQILKSIPAYFVRAQSSEAQDLFLGAPSEQLLNFPRLNNFLNTLTPQNPQQIQNTQTQHNQYPQQNIHPILNLPHPMD